MKNEPLVSIIIVNWNGQDVLSECLTTLKAIDYKEKELILIDNNSSDKSVTIANEFKKFFKRFTIIKNKSNVGFAVANNQGLERSKGKYILLLNNDTKVTPKFLSNLVQRIEKDSVLGVIQPKICLMDKPDYLDNAGSFLTKIGFLKHWGFMEKDREEFSEEREIFSAKGACMLIRKSITEKVGLFDPDFHSYFEESDFCWRVWLTGYKVIYYPQSMIYHKVGFTIKRLNVVDLNYHYYKNRICSLIKNLEYKNFLLVLFSHLIISLGIAIIFLVKFQFKNMSIILRAIAWNINNFKNTLKKRDFIQNIRIIEDDKLFHDLSKPIDILGYWRDFLRIEKDLSK